jgi:ActR/RegA family two-component response regulator
MTPTINNVLILEPDKEFAQRFMRTLKHIGAFTIAAMPTLKEACLHLMQAPQDLAFIPVTEGDKIVRSLRAVQPNLRLVLMTPQADYELPNMYAGAVQAVMIKPLMDIELPAIIEDAFDNPLISPGTAKAVEDEIAALDTAILIATLNQAQLGRLVQSVVFAQGTKMLAYWGELKEREAGAVAIYAGKNWSGGAQRSRVQFMHLPARAGDMLLYTHHILEDYYLTLVALPETPLGELRAQASRMVVSLKKVVMGKTAPLTLPEIKTNIDGRSTFAIVWQPVQALPTSLHIPLRRAIERLAVANACVPTHILVRAEFVHLVVNCPPGRDSTWAAYLFKNGSEQTIQQQYGVAASLWETGFYAVASDDPLSDTELNLFLEHNTI